MAILLVMTAFILSCSRTSSNAPILEGAGETGAGQTAGIQLPPGLDTPPSDIPPPDTPPSVPGGPEGNQTAETSAETGAVSANKVTTSSEGETVLHSPHSQLTIPAGGFSEPITVEVQADVAEPPPEGLLVTPVVTYHFSKPQMMEMDKTATLALRIPESFNLDQPVVEKTTNGTGQTVLNVRLVAMVKVQGERVSFGHAAGTEWRTVYGSVDRNSRTYSLNLYASSERLSVVLVKPEGLKLYIVPPHQGNSSLLDLFLKKAYADIPRWTINWGESQWVVECTDLGLGLGQNEARTRCDQENPSSFLNQVAGGLAFATERLYREGGLTRAYLEQLEDTEDGDKIYNVVHIGTSSSCGAEFLRGCYDPGSGGLIITTSAQNNSRVEILQVVAHELAHAIQRGYIPLSLPGNDGTNDFLVEGTAEFLGNQLTGSSEVYAPRLGHRDFEFPLHSAEGLNAYEASQFWGLLARDGDWGYIKPFFNAILDEFTIFFRREGGAQNIYGALDQPAQRVFGRSFPDLYLSAMKARSEFPYPHCKTIIIEEEKMEYHDAKTLKPMSSLCLRIQTQGQEFDRYRIQFAGTPPDTPFGLILNGVPYRLPVRFNIKRVGNSLVFWLSNVHMSVVDRESFALFDIYLEKKEKEEEDEDKEEKEDEDKEESAGGPPCQPIWPRAGEQPIGVCLNCCPGAYEKLNEILRAEREARNPDRSSDPLPELPPDWR